MRGRAAALAAWLPLALLAAGARAGPCLPVAGGGELSVQGVGSVVFAGLATDRARDSARVFGSVCLTFAAIDGVLRTESLEFTGLDGDLALTAAAVRLELPGWQLSAAALAADGERAILTDVAMLGTEAVALAASLTIDLASGRVEASSLRLATESVRMDALHAVLDGDEVWGVDARLTTCDCSPAESGVRLEAGAVRIDLARLRVRIEAGTLVTGSVRWPLPDPLEVDEASLRDLALPFSWGPDPDGRRGTVVRGRETVVAPGARSWWEIGGGEGDRPPDVGVRLVVDTPGANLDLRAASDRLRIEWEVRRQLAGGWAAAIGQRLEGGAWDAPVRDQRVAIDWSVRWARPAVGLASFDLAAAGFAALSAQSLAGDEVVGPRLGVVAESRLATVQRNGAVARLGIDGGATVYPAVGGGAPAAQAFFALTPSARLQGGDWRLDIDHLARWVAGGSPFGVSLDRVLPAQRTDLTLALATAAGAGWSLEASLRTRFDWRPDSLRPGRARGVERLGVRLELAGPAWDGRLEVVGEAALAGLVDPRPGRPTRASLGAAWSRAGLELGARGSVSWDAGTTAWREVAVFAAVPFTTGDVSWRPYLAVDLAAWTRDGEGWLAGHGLDLAWATRYGVIEAGYRHDTTLGTSVHLGVTLEAHRLDLDRLEAEPAASAPLAGEGVHGRVPALVRRP